MNNIAHITSLYSASWMAWVMFVLLVVGLLSPLTRVTSMTLQSIFSRSERSYAVHVRSRMSGLALHIFRFGIVAMAMLLCAFPQGAFSFLSYLKVFGGCAILYTLQTLVLYGVVAVFVSPKRMGAIKEQYDSIRTSVCACAYPILLVLVNIPSISALPWIFCGIVFVVYVIVLFAKAVQLLYTHPLSVLYILLYVVCLEILPLMISIFVVQSVL